MAKARKVDIEMTYLHVGGEDIQKYASIDDVVVDDGDDDDAVTKKEPSPGEVPYLGVPATPAPCPCSDGFYDKRLPAQESRAFAGENIKLEMADEKVHKYLEIVHDVSTKQEQSPDNVLQTAGPDEPEPVTSSDWFNERPPMPESSSVLGATANMEMTCLQKGGVKVPKYLERVDDVMTKKENASNIKGQSGYEIPVKHVHHYKESEESRLSNLNVQGTSAALVVNLDGSQPSSDEAVNVLGTSAARQVNPAVSPRAAMPAPTESAEPIYQEIQ